MSNRIESTRAPRSNVERVLEILSSFDDHNTPIRSSEVCHRLDIKTSTGLALIRTLIGSGLLEKSAHGYIRLGDTARNWIFSPFSSRYQTLLNLRSINGDGRNAARQLPIVPRATSWDSALTDTVDTHKFLGDGPYRLSFSNASLSNPWRAAVLKSMSYAIHSHKTTVQSFVTRCAQDSLDKQLKDIDELMILGTDVLLISAVHEGNKPLIDKLRDVINAGVPVIAVGQSPGCSSAMNSFVTASDASIGRISAIWLAEHLQGRGRVWLLSGAKGSSPAIHREKAARQAFSEFPDIHIEAVAYTNFEAANGRSAVNQLLKEYGTAADGVWCDSGLQGIGSIDAFIERSMPVPPHTGGDLNCMYKRALEYQVPFVALDCPAAMGARAIEIALDLKSGKPILRRIETSIQVVVPRGFETMSVKADEWAEHHVRWQLPDNYVLSQGASLHWNEDVNV